MNQSHSTALAALCSRTLDGLKAENIVALDLRTVDSAPADFFLICSATSDVHARALNDALTRATVSVGERRPRSEGRDVGDWVLLDYFDVVVHIFRTESREYYKLEKLWGDAPVVDCEKLEQEEGEQEITETTIKAPKAKTSARKAASGEKASAPKKAATAKTTTAKASTEAAPKKAATKATNVSAEKASTEKAPKAKATTTKTTTKAATTKKSPRTTKAEE
ncbi:MAG: ribosome silencing factor [Candidatus Kapaibacterium sp.]|nr:MAG: ribosome silencing factor [Candidatus Kapabacteria bacterium]